MDPSRFDDLARVLSLNAASGRRPLLAALLATALGGTLAEAAARKRGKDGRHDRNEREPDGRLRAEGRGKRRKKKKKKRGGNGGGATPPPECCGTDSCPAPERGGTSANCDFASRDFSGQNLNGSIFRGIDGRNADFSNTDTRGSVFAEACLQGARFRNADLDDSTWEDACLFGADFAGADLDRDDPLFAEARFCNTRMPDGSVNDRDCGRETACCRRGDEEPGPECRADGGACALGSDCCGGNCFGRVCADRPRFCVNTTCPGNAVGCCNDNCCTAPANQCNPGGLCCAPNCTGKQCGADGCGSGGTCGTCAAGQACDGDGRCACTPQSCPDGCCDASGLCQPGTASQACGAGGRACAVCPDGQSCQDRACACTPDCAGKNCGQDGCGGSCGSCADGQRCQNGQCICDAQSCRDGCCANGPGNSGACRAGTNRQACGTGGERCDACPTGQDCLGRRCAVCGPQTCPDGCCAANGTCQSGESFGACGGPGGGPCASCNDSQTCQDRQCVACGPNCVCTGQSVCLNEEAPNVSCAPDFCNCYVSIAGRPICGGNITILEPNGCSNDADCGAGNACIASNDAPGPCGGNGKPFCVTPCCIPQCAGKVCGPDGCGGTCGTCPGALVCNASGQCVSTCTPQTCPDGCCGADGSCRPGTAKAACGKGGAACQACGAAAVCRGQQCEACVPKTCQELGLACGPAPDGCDGTLQCGACPLGTAPSCQNGQCLACADACSAPCAVCLQAPDGTTLCAGNAVTFCAERPTCTSDADCAGSQLPTCVTTSVDRGTGEILNFPEICQTPGAAGICSGLAACCAPDCTGKTCGPDGCGSICGECGPCQECQNGTCRDLCSQCQACQGNTCQTTGLVCGGQCCALKGTCCTDTSTPYCCEEFTVCDLGTCGF